MACPAELFFHLCTPKRCHRVPAACWSRPWHSLCLSQQFAEALAGKAPVGTGQNRGCASKQAQERRPVLKSTPGLCFISEHKPSFPDPEASNGSPGADCSVRHPTKCNSSRGGAERTRTPRYFDLAEHVKVFGLRSSSLLSVRCH